MELASQPRPRFRTDLVAECIEADGQRFIDVIDPDTGDAFRFYEVEYSLACAMDGERDVRGLAQWAKEELGIEPSPSELQNVITTLGGLGYLESAGRDVELGAGVVTRPVERVDLPIGDVELGRPGYAGGPGRQEPLPMSRGDEMQLGFAGGSPAARARDSVEDVELGMPGAASEPMGQLRRGPTRPDADEDGPTHLPEAAVGDFDDDEVSVDLSEHLSLRPDDVKEAVRMSRSMKVVEVPPELLDEIGQKEQEAAQRARENAEAAQRMAAPYVPPAPPPPPVEMRQPVELPEKPVVVSRKDRRPAVEPPPVVAPTPPPAKSGGTSKLLIVLLLLALLGAGGFFVWKYVINKPKDQQATTKEPGKEPAKEPGKEPAKEPGKEPTKEPGKEPTKEPGKEPTPTKEPTVEAPSATLGEKGEVVDVSGGKGGVVTFVAAEGSTVQQGDPIVQYKGAAPLLVRLGTTQKGLVYDIEVRYPEEIKAATEKRDAAVAAGNKAKAKAAQNKLDERTARLAFQKGEADKLRAKIAAFSVPSPVTGTVTSPVKKGAFVKADGLVARIDTGKMLVATFDMTGQPGEAPELNASVRIAAKDQPDQKANCQVFDVQAPKLTVSCAVDIGMAAGTVVVLEP